MERHRNTDHKYRPSTMTSSYVSIPILYSYASIQARFKFCNSHCTILVNDVDMDITGITATNHERQYR